MLDGCAVQGCAPAARRRRSSALHRSHALARNRTPMSFPYPAGPEILYVTGYAFFLLLVSVALELGARRAHSYLRSSRTAGFRYLNHLDAWECSQGRRLWMHRRDSAKKASYYRADSRHCNNCPVKRRCTNSDEGRELVVFQSYWPQSDIERFQRGMSLALIILALFIMTLEFGQHHAAGDVALLASVMAP